MLLIAMAGCREPGASRVRGVRAAFAEVDAGVDNPYTCAVTIVGEGYCWGLDDVDELGDTAVDQRCASTLWGCQTAPVAVAGTLAFTAISAGFDHACALAVGGAAYCWGDNHNGQLGTGDTLWSHVPVPVAGGLTFQSVSAGVYHTCALTTGGKAYCWGDNYDGALGNGESGTSSYFNLSPMPVSGGLTFKLLGAGWEHTCGLTAAGTVYCWGHNYHGDLGNDNPNLSTTPVAVNTSLTFDTLSVGSDDECGLTSSGAAYCWGYNFVGELGTGNTTDTSVPTPVVGGLTFSSISPGYAVTCGVTTHGGVAYCWGNNVHGELGNPNAPHGNNPSPVPVSGNLTFRSVSAGYLHACGVTVSGDIYCWGEGQEGQLGDGAAVTSFTPVRVRRP